MKNKAYIIASWLLVLTSICIYLQSCKHNETNTPEFITTPYVFPSPKYFPTVLNIPPENPTTIEGVKLGRYLYYDGRISGRTDTLMSCSTCHLQSRSFECGDKFDQINTAKGFPVGATGIQAPHQMLPHINLVYNFNYTWNGGINNGNATLGGLGAPPKPQFNFRNLESLFWIVLYLPYEMNSDSARAINALKNIQHPNYPALFKAAFGTSEINVDRIGKAIAQFVRTLISYNSRFDKYMRREPEGTLNASELRGYQLFISEPADCFHCHGPAPLFTTNLFYNNAKPILKFDESDRYGYTHDSLDIGAYKATTLRNIELTGPYMHDGRFTTLEEVVEFYSSGLVVSPSVSPLMKHLNTGGALLSDQQKADLVSFLKTLTDYKFISDTAFAKPSDL